MLQAVDLLGDALVKLVKRREADDKLALISSPGRRHQRHRGLAIEVERIERRLGKPDPVPARGLRRSGALQRRHRLCLPVEPASAELLAPAGSGNGEAESVQEPTSDAPALDVSFEQLQKVWPGLFGSLRDVLGARRWAFFREAVPAAVEQRHRPRSARISSASHCKRTTRSQQSWPPGPGTFLVARCE